MEKISALIISIEKMKVMKFGHPDHHKKYLKVAPLRSLYFREDISVNDHEAKKLCCDYHSYSYSGDLHCYTKENSAFTVFYLSDKILFN